MVRDRHRRVAGVGGVLPMALVNVVVNMSQMSAMVEGAYGAMGMLPPPAARRRLGLVVVTIVLTVAP